MPAKQQQETERGETTVAGAEVIGKEVATRLDEDDKRLVDHACGAARKRWSGEIATLKGGRRGVCGRRQRCGGSCLRGSRAREG
jgi:hypothetical protein